MSTQHSQLSWQSKNSSDLLFKLSQVLDYINLLAAISQAQNSAAVETLLESEALPAGSSRIKKVTAVNIAVNAYVGGFARTGDNSSGFTNTYGLTAPIGFTFSHGWDKGGSISIFAGVFDIGGIIRYKLDNQGAYQQDVSLAGILSPSLHVAYGFFSWLPLTIGAGWQWVSPGDDNLGCYCLKTPFQCFSRSGHPIIQFAICKKIAGRHYPIILLSTSSL